MSRKVSQKELIDFDAWAFCRIGGTIAGSQSELTLTRLYQESGATRVKISAWQVVGYTDRVGQSVLHLSGAFEVDFPCALCDQPATEQLSIDRRLMLCRSEQQADEKERECEQEDVDFVACLGSINLHDWLEDEFLLACPMFSRHVECKQSRESLDVPQSMAGEVTDEAESSNEESRRPFAALGALLSKRGKQ